MAVKRLTTRGRATAEAIRDRVPFTTSGALRAESAGVGLSSWDSGQLSGDDLDKFRGDARIIDYVVYSYATPIAWHTAYGSWHKVAQKFSITTTKHQGNLYLVEAP